MKEPNRIRKNPIKYEIQLSDEQKLAKQLILDNQITIITGRPGSGKSAVGAITCLDFLNQKQCNKILITRAMIETGKSMGYLPGSKEEKYNPYIEALIENLYKCTDKERIDNYVKSDKIQGYPIQFIRGKTIDDVLIVEEAQNISKHEMEAILTRLGKTGKIIINGDNSQRDTHFGDGGVNGLDFAIELSKNIDGIGYIKLKNNHRSGMVGKILDYIYGK